MGTAVVQLGSLRWYLAGGNQSMRFLSMSVICIAPAGCASLREHDCRSDWYLVGFRDGRLPTAANVEAYAGECARYGIQPDARRYREGWEAGNRALRAP